MKRFRIAFVTALAALLAPAGSAVRGSAQSKAAAQAKAAAQDIAASKAYGSKTAPITIEEFSDFQCPACRQLYLETLRPLMDDYVATGKVYLVHRDFPLPAHKYGREAARYANAAARIGRFDRVEEALFGKQTEWSANGNLEAAVASVLTPAEMKRVQQLAHSSPVDEAIEKDVALGNQFQVNRTPTMIVTHKGQKTPIVGVVSYQIFRMWLDNQLK